MVRAPIARHISEDSVDGVEVGIGPTAKRCQVVQRTMGAISTEEMCE